MSRLPIRARLSAAFALAMVVVLVAAGLFVFVRLRADLDDGVNDTLDTRAAAVAASGEVTAGAPDDREDGFAQRVSPDGRVLDTTGPGPVLTRAEIRERLRTERDVDGVDGTVRVLAVPGDGETVVIGQSLEDRDETLGRPRRGVRRRGAARDRPGLAARLRPRRCRAAARGGDAPDARRASRSTARRRCRSPRRATRSAASARR